MLMRRRSASKQPRGSNPTGTRSARCGTGGWCWRSRDGGSRPGPERGSGEGCLPTSPGLSPTLDARRVRSAHPPGSRRTSPARRSWHMAPRSRSSGSCRASSAGRSGASSSASPGRARIWPPSRPGPSSMATSGWWMARRCGPRVPTSRASASSSPAPTPPYPSTKACRTSSSTWTSPASRCGRTGR